MRARVLATLLAGLALAAAGTLLSPPHPLGPPEARADWLQPDATYRDAQFLLRAAVRDTVGQHDNPARLDTLGAALLRLGRLDEAAVVFRHVLALQPGDAAATAGLGKMALFADRLAEAESLLTVSLAGVRDPAVVFDLFATELRQGRYARAAELSAEVNQPGRAAQLQHMAEREPYRVSAGPDEVRIPWAKGYPVPLVRVKLNGESVLMAIDTGVRDLLIDQWVASRAKVQRLSGQSLAFWLGSRVSVQHASVQRLRIGGLEVQNLPAGITSLRKWSMQVNPQGEPVAGVIGIELLRGFMPTLDYDGNVLVLRRGAAAYQPRSTVLRVPFEIWGEGELTVYGTLAGGRRMAMVVATGVPECGVAAPVQVFEEVGLKAGAVSRAIKGAGTWLSGHPWARVTLPAMTVGPVAADKVPGWAGVLDPDELWRHGVRRDAIVSHDFFKNRRVTIDWSTHELIVEERR